MDNWTELKNLDSSKLDSKAPSPAAQDPPAPLLPAKEAAHLILLPPRLLFLRVTVQSWMLPSMRSLFHGYELAPCIAQLSIPES